MGSLQGQNVVVVGGSRGVGRAIVEAALGEGATVLAVARGADTLRQLAQDLPGVRTLVADATDDAAPAAVFRAMRPDVLVLCAGAIPPAASLHEMSWAAFSGNWETDVKAAFLFCGAALRQPLPPGSRVIVISSGAALSGGPPFCGGYAGAKRMQTFLAGYAQKEADRLGLAVRFMDLAPLKLMPGTDVGKSGVDGYADYAGIDTASVLARMGAGQSPADVGRAVVAMATGTSAAVAFTVGENGLAAVV